VPPDESIEHWSDDAIWEEMLIRMRTDDGWQPAIGRIVQKSGTPQGSFVTARCSIASCLAGDAVDHQRQLADLDYVTSSRAAMTSLAEQYVGLPRKLRCSRSGSNRVVHAPCPVLNAQCSMLKPWTIGRLDDWTIAHWALGIGHWAFMFNRPA